MPHAREKENAPRNQAHSTTFVSVAVIGGGVAGLAAAGALCSSSTPSSPSSERHQQVLLLEAREELGGRVRQLHGLAPWPVEMGPEFIHGERSSVVKIFRDAGCSLREYEWPDRWFFDDERILRRASGAVGDDEDDRDAATTTITTVPSSSSSSVVVDVDVDVDERERDVALVQKLFASVAEEEENVLKPSDCNDISATEWMLRKGLATKRQRDVAEACFANDFGAPLDELGLRELAVENAEWDVGDAYYVPDAPMSELVKALRSRLGPPRSDDVVVRRRWPVSKVEVLEGRRRRGKNEDLRALFSAFASSSSEGCLHRLRLPRRLVRLTGPRGEVVVARRVVVAVPLAVLKASLLPLPPAPSSSSSSSSSPPPPRQRRPPSAIEFSPPLSAAKLAAVGRLRVGNAIKIVLSFSRAFWPEGFFDAVCPGCFVPEFWVKAPPAERHHRRVRAAGGDGGNRSAGERLSPFVVTGFLCGRFAEAAQALGEEETVRRALRQLDEMFGGGPPRPESGTEGGGGGKGQKKSDDSATTLTTTTPATDALVSSRVVDWSLDPWALGAYSFPSLGALPGDRRALASPEGGGGGTGGTGAGTGSCGARGRSGPAAASASAVLFFAGEATHEAVNPCLQAAIETGERAAREVMEAAAADEEEQEEQEEEEEEEEEQGREARSRL